MRRLSAFLTILFLTLNFTACGNRNGSEDTIRFAISRTDWNTLGVIAAEKGFFAEQGLNVEITYLPTGVQCLEALVSNSADIGTIVDVNLANLGYTENTNISVVACINTTASVGIIARRSTGIETPEDLRNRRIAVSFGTTSEVYANNFINKYNLSSDIEIINVPANTIVAALISESVDAIVSWNPFLYNAQEALNGDVTYFNEDDVYDMFLGVNNNYINENRSNVIKFLNAIEKAAIFVENNESEAQEIIARVVNLDIEAVKDSWQLHNFNVSLSAENLERVIGIGEYFKNDTANRGKPFPEYSTYFDYSLLEEFS
jgi:NitT/TauT family transport system substrate-binding protein